MQGLQVQSLHRCQPPTRVEWEKGRVDSEAFHELLALSLYTPSGVLTKVEAVSINSAHLVCGIFQVDIEPVCCSKFWVHSRGGFNG